MIIAEEFRKELAGMKAIDPLEREFLARFADRFQSLEAKINFPSAVRNYS